MPFGLVVPAVYPIDWSASVHSCGGLCVSNVTIDRIMTHLVPLPPCLLGPCSLSSRALSFGQAAVSRYVESTTTLDCSTDAPVSFAAHLYPVGACGRLQ